MEWLVGDADSFHSVVLSDVRHAAVVMASRQRAGRACMPRGFLGNGPMTRMPFVAASLRNLHRNTRPGCPVRQSRLEIRPTWVDRGFWPRTSEDPPVASKSQARARMREGNFLASRFEHNAQPRRCR